MLSLRVVQYEHLLDITKLGISQNPYGLLVDGPKMSQARVVYINKTPVEDFVLLRPNQLLVSIPAAYTRDTIRDIRVASIPRVSQTLKSDIRFSFEGSAVSGIERLAQKVLFVMMTSQGSTLVEPSVGGGAQKLIGTTMSDGNMEKAVRDVIKKAQTDILATQSENAPADERLLLIEVNSITTGDDFVSAGIRINSIGGGSAIVEVGL